MARYDEDLHENPFFQTLNGKFGSLFKEAAENKWMIFVPRCDTVPRLKLNKSDFENHILRPCDSSNNKLFISVNNKHASIEGDIVRVGQGYKETRNVKILFEECFYNSCDESYQVFCLEQPIEGALSDDIIISLENLEDCNRFLWSEASSEKVRKSVDKLLEIFNLERGTSLRSIIDTALAVFTRAVQEVFKLRKFQAATQKNFCKLAVETYVLAGLHKKVFKEVCFLVAQKDAAFNKITRNLSDTHPQYLGVRPQFRLCIPKAKAMLSQLNQFVTPLEKLYCFKKSISALTEMPLEGTHEAMTADELLPILVYLVIACDIPNWNGNLTYISKFHFSNVGMEEFAYYMTSFEAAVEYVRNEAHKIEVSTTGLDKAMVERLRSSSNATSEDSDPVKQFFKGIYEGNVEEVQRLLDHTQHEAEAAKAKMCHPLCTCEKCTALLDRQLYDSDRVTVYSRDENGRTGLHHAARMGHNVMVELLLQHGAIVGATDHNGSTSLHLACQKGHQKCTLLLLGDGSSVNGADNHGNTPLHLACSNGHEECVKALLFHKGDIQCGVNLANEQGDTPLHNAARWGYASIVSVLLQHGAQTNKINRRREVPQQCAQSRKVQELLAGPQRKSTRSSGREEGVDGSLSSSTSPVVMRKGQRTKRMSQRESLSEIDRQLKKLFRAIQDGDINYVKYLFGWEEDKSPSVIQSELCHPLCQCDRCSKLRKSSILDTLSVNSCDSNGHTPLHKAALLGQVKTVQLLLRHGALINAKTKQNQHTPLHLACQYNHRDVVLVLLDNGAQIDPQDAVGNTPLHFTCSNGHMDAAAILLIHGADVSVANHRGDTPLHSAARWNHPRLVTELMLYGAQYTVTNNDGKMPIDLTKDEEVQEVITKAINGEITIGSYSPIRPRNTHPHPHQHSVVGALTGISIIHARGENTSEAQVSDSSKSQSGRESEHQALGQQVHDAPPAEQGTPPLPAKSSPTPRRDEKLRELMRAIESYDRAVSLRQTETDDRSAPFLNTGRSHPCTNTLTDEQVHTDTQSTTETEGSVTENHLTLFSGEFGDL